MHYKAFLLPAILATVVLAQDQGASQDPGTSGGQLDPSEGAASNTTLGGGLTIPNVAGDPTPVDTLAPVNGTDGTEMGSDGTGSAVIAPALAGTDTTTSLLSPTDIIGTDGITNGTVPPSMVDAAVLAAYDTNFVNAKLDDSRLGFGVPLASKAVLQVSYPAMTLTEGRNYSVESVASLPAFSATADNSTANTFTADTRYTILLADASSLGDVDPEGNYVHYMANGYQGASPASGVLAFTPRDPETVINYAAPGPIAGSGPHRYSWLMFLEPTDFEAPSNFSSQSPVPAGHYSVQEYANAGNLTLVAATYFILQNGEPTGTVTPLPSIVGGDASSNSGNSTTNTPTANEGASGSSGNTGSGGKTSTSASSSPSSSSSAKNPSRSAAPAASTNGGASLMAHASTAAFTLVGILAVTAMSTLTM